jgi:hypothetical protein
MFGRNIGAVTLKTGIELSGDGVRDRQLIDALVDETLFASTIAERLSPDAVRVNLIPIMPLHVAFWLGAGLGYTHAREIAVHSIRQADGAPARWNRSAAPGRRHPSRPMLEPDGTRSS